MQKQIIENIEIKYFRSVHEGKLVGCRPLNLIVGGNDTGKSNILRALNLFFKNRTDIDDDYVFERDISLKRISEAKAAKGRAFLYVKITFNNVLGYESLPEQFTIKKQWNRYQEQPDQTVFPQKHKGKNIPQNILARFLNQIELHYVPAIKGRSIFSYYLEQLYDVISQKNLNLSGASEDLTSVINNATSDMADRIEKQIGVTSRISVPQNFRSLFGRLEFLTKVGLDKEVSLRQRGDGVQVGHIPYILDFICRERKNKASIWLYEEPENSLELTKAFDLAKKFSLDFSKRNQIFITTHSPAFYSVADDSVGKWQVQRLPSEDNEDPYEISIITPLSNIDNVDEMLGVTALVSEKAKEIIEHRATLQKELSEIKQATKPQVLCEGKTDVIYVKKAVELMAPDLIKKCEIRQVGTDNCGNGCDRLLKVKNLLEDSPHLFNQKNLLVFDCDVTKVRTGNNKQRAFWYRFPKHSGAIEKGIENALSSEAISLINASEFQKEETKEYGGVKTVTTRELDKMKACQYLCSKENETFFQNFSGLIDEMKKLVN